jgi:hypothetical protein
MTRGAIGWALFVGIAQLSRVARWIAGPGELERRLADRAWLEQRPTDYERRPW